MPVLHNNVRYNCRIFCLNKKIILIRPKVYMADDGNYRERRYFTSWKDQGMLENHTLSDILRDCNGFNGQTIVPFGVATIATMETILAAEICEELWTPESPHISLALNGVEIFSNGSGSHHELRKLNSRLLLMKNATSKCGGAYLYSNHRGCDGTRMYFDGCSLVCVNGELVAQASQFSLQDVEVIIAIVDLNEIRSYRMSSASFQEQSSNCKKIPQIDLRHFSLRPDPVSSSIRDISPTKPIVGRIHTPEEECAMGPACWLWDYLRRSGASGFLLPLSGGADSSSVAAIVRVMCGMAVEAAEKGETGVLADIHRITGYPVVPIAASVTASGAKELVSDSSNKGIGFNITPEELCSSVLHTVYMGTGNSSQATRSRSQRLAQAIGSYHHAINIDAIVAAVLHVFTSLTSVCTSKSTEAPIQTQDIKSPRYESQGGTPAEDLALQNIQARLRMVMAYLCAQLLPWVRGRKGYLLVLGSANVDEALRGYMTKYDCSSADINPIGGICKVDLKRLMLYAAKKIQLPILEEIANAPPTAELRPIEEGETADYSQTDEDDMGMSYEELGIYGSLRKIQRCGPVSMFMKLVRTWRHFSPLEVAVKVKRFFYFYSVNRHKMTVLTPSYHAESYSPDDNRFDLRQFLYNTKWTRQFNTIDAIVEKANTKV
mmetsp:Transcript_11338/g.10985  ORF Transcript_11338/g.10985 Transcript_11338/m.10985 type:complete len:662 (+) Transcript_11338:371-2356(+)